MRPNPCEFDMAEPTKLFEALGEGTRIHFSFAEKGYLIYNPDRKTGSGDNLIHAVGDYMTKNEAIYDHNTHTYRFPDEEN